MFTPRINTWSIMISNQFSCQRSVLFVFNAFHFDLVIDQLVDIGDDCRALNVHEHKWRDDRSEFQTSALAFVSRTIVNESQILVDGVVSSCSWSRIYEELAVVLVSFKFVSVASDEDVDPELALEGGQRFRVSPRNYLMAVAQTDFELTHCHYLLFRVGAGYLSRTN